MIILNRSRHPGSIPAQLGSVLRQPLRARLRLPAGQPVEKLAALRDAAAARLERAEAGGVLARGSAAVKLGRLAENGVELMVTVRGWGPGGYVRVAEGEEAERGTRHAARRRAPSARPGFNTPPPRPRCCRQSMAWVAPARRS